MRLKFRDRIALFHLAAASVILAIFFLAVYLVVHYTEYRHLDRQLESERVEVMSEILVKNDSLVVDLEAESREPEHQAAESTPVFLQVADIKGNTLFKSANMSGEVLQAGSYKGNALFSDARFNGIQIRQAQFPILSPERLVLGSIIIGVPREESSRILSNLGLTMAIAFPLMLLALFIASRKATSRGIRPVSDLIRQTDAIGDRNLQVRIRVNEPQDEIRKLGETINGLLDRIERSLNREKQVTSDISHELRTPVTAIRGTLEVLLRRARDPLHYQEKIGQVLSEVDRMDRTIGQLLQIARIDAGVVQAQMKDVAPGIILRKIGERRGPVLKEREILFMVDIRNDETVTADEGLLEIILDNLVGNAINHGGSAQTILCLYDPMERELSVSDGGPGIATDLIPVIFDRFRRGDPSRNSAVQGSGLGLSIVKMLADLQRIDLSVRSNPGKGTTFLLRFPR